MNGEHPATAQHLPKLKATRDAIAALAQRQQLPFADLLGAMDCFKPTTVNGTAYTESDYATAAPLLTKALGLETSSAPQNEPVRQLIRQKNELFFHRWRPQNEIYLFGSRKHEQGNNGIEIPQFDPLLAKKEAEIAALLKQ
jgi:hypothetical protein